MIQVFIVIQIIPVVVQQMAMYTGEISVKMSRGFDVLKEGIF